MKSRPGKIMSNLRSRLENIVSTVKYAIPFTAMAFIAQEAKGQNIVYPSGVINPFISPDNTEAAATYNALNSRTRAERDALADAIIKASRVHTIPPNDDPVFNCNNWRRVQIMNSYDWGDGIYETYDSDKLLFNGYKGFVLSEIYANGGTFADQGKDGLALFGVTLKFNESYNHAMVTLLTGNNALVGSDWNDIEPRDGVTNVKPGEINIPLNTDIFIVYVPYIFKNSMHDKNFAYFRVLEFDIVNGEKILTYNINNDSGFNTRMRLITQRESNPPTIYIKQGTAPDSLVCTINDQNLKSVWYTVDGGAKIPLMTEVLPQVTEKKIAIKMNLPNGTHQIRIGADDYFRLLTEKTETRNMEAIVNAPPVINITTPTEGTVYDKDISLTYSITDNDFASAWYSIDNGVTKIPIGQSGTIPLSLANGLYTLLLQATDTRPQSTDASRNFEMKKTTGIEDPTLTEGIKIYPIPVTDFLNIEYKTEKEQRIYRELYSVDGRLIYNDRIEVAGEQLDRMDFSRYASVMSIMN